MEDMSANSNTEPVKGILKRESDPKPSHAPKSTTTKPKHTQEVSKGHAHFDESNIQQTLHPENKDYGFDRIDEPKTPYHEYEDPEQSGSSVTKKNNEDKSKMTSGAVDPSMLSNMLKEKGSETPKSVTETQAKSTFEEKRKQHYDEFQKVKMGGNPAALQRDERRKE